MDVKGEHVPENWGHIRLCPRRTGEGGVENKPLTKHCSVRDGCRGRIRRSDKSWGAKACRDL